MHLAKRMLISLAFILSATWLALVFIVYIFQEYLIYVPSKDMGLSPAAIYLEYEDIYLPMKDGQTLHGWFIEHEQPQATLLFLHGNAGNISHRLDSIKIFHRLGLSVLIIDYRGYGQSGGKPSEHGTYEDAQAAWEHLVKERQIPAEDIIIFGRSLGGGVASWLASQHKAAALILESTFTSIVDMGKHYYPYLPISLLARIRYDSIERVGNIDYPILIIHSPDDELVPYKLGQKLYESATKTRSFLSIQGGHNDGFYTSGEKYVQGLTRFISELSTCPTANTGKNDFNSELITC